VSVPWTLIEHTADVGLELRAATLDDLFVDAAAGLFDVVTDVTRIETRDEVTFDVTADAADFLLVAWLEELLYRFDTAGELFIRGEAHVTGDGGDGHAWSLHAHMRGERFDPERHPLKVQVKAITYHGLELAQDEHGWRARVIFDL
jgi:SHS2 domain-containing protein